MNRPMRVLVVDDSRALVELLVAVLCDAGLEALPALGAVAAIDLFEADPRALSDFDLVLSDQQMPDLTGTELAAWLAQRGGPPVLLMSGCVEEDEADSELGGTGAIGILSKPFPLASMLERVRSLCGSRGPR
jgi:two-component system cell cycle sensor histidine kinase/response regulator CckA